MISTGGSYGVKIKPWLQVPGDDFFVIKLNSIITMTEVNDETIIEFYNRYLEDNEEDDVLYQ
jgi:hypothetical protein